MKKTYFILSLAAVLLIFGSCGRGGKTLSDINDPTPADSMMFYFGAMQAFNYWQDASTDTLLQSDKARKDFMDGFRRALTMESSDAAYNKGLQLGLRLAIRLRDFDRYYDADFSEDVLASALEYFLQSDTLIDISEAQAQYYRIKDRYDLNTASREIADAKVLLAKRARARGYEMVSDTLFAQDVTPPTTGPRLKEGDRVALSITASTLDGKEIVTRQFPDSVTLGEGRVPLIVRYALFTMTDGQTRRFMTTPRTLFGKRYAAYKLPSDVPVIFTVKVQR